MLRLAGPFLLVMLSLCAGAGALTPIATTRNEHSVSAKTDLNDRPITVREMLVDVGYMDGRARKGALAVFFDAASGRYLWEFGPVPQSEGRSTMTSAYGSTALIHVANDRVVLFGFSGHLVVHESLGKASGIDDAEAKAFAEATAALPAKLTGRTDDRVIIPLGKLLPRGFFGQEDSPINGPLKIVSISHKGNTWELVLEGQWQEKVTLDEKYKLIGTNRLN